MMTRAETNSGLAVTSEQAARLLAWRAGSVMRESFSRNWRRMTALLFEPSDIYFDQSFGKAELGHAPCAPLSLRYPDRLSRPASSTAPVAAAARLRSRDPWAGNTFYLRPDSLVRLSLPHNREHTCSLGRGQAF